MKLECMFNLLTQSLSSLFLALFGTSSSSATFKSGIIGLSIAGDLNKGESDLSDEIVHMLHVMLIYLELQTLKKILSVGWMLTSVSLVTLITASLSF